MAVVMADFGERDNAGAECGVIRQLVQAGDGRMACPPVCCPPTQVMVTLTSSLSGDTDDDVLRQDAQQFLPSACVVEGACQTCERSLARAWIAARSARVRVAGCYSVNRW